MKTAARKDTIVSASGAAYYEPSSSLELAVSDAETQHWTVSQTRKSTTSLWLLSVLVSLLLFVVLERLAFYTLQTNIVLYCTSILHFDQVKATNIYHMFSGGAYIIPIFGGYLADDRLGRYPSILLSSIIYLIGLAFLVLSPLDFGEMSGISTLTREKPISYIIALTLVAIGNGGIIASVPPFGAEQSQASDSGNREVSAFFMWFYWCSNAGSLFAETAVAYILQQMGFTWGYFSAFVSMVIAVIMLAGPSKKYQRTEPAGGTLQTFAGIFRQGCCQPEQQDGHQRSDNDGYEFKIFSGAKIKYGGDFEDQVVDSYANFVMVIPFCVSVIMYWAIYAQMDTTFFVQAEHMDLRMGDYLLPITAISSFNSISVLILAPFIYEVLYPFLEAKGTPLTLLRKIGIGMILTFCAALMAGGVEIYRKTQLTIPGGSFIQVIEDKNYTASILPVYYQIPQFVFVGASEVFLSISVLQFAYEQASVPLQGILTGMFISTTGFGNWVSMMILNGVRYLTKSDPWWSSEINEAHVENLFFLLAALMFMNLTIFMWLANRYIYIDPDYFKRGSFASSSTNPVPWGHSSFTMRREYSDRQSHFSDRRRTRENSVYPAVYD